MRVRDRQRRRADRSSTGESQAGSLELVSGSARRPSCCSAVPAAPLADVDMGELDDVASRG